MFHLYNREKLRKTDFSDVFRGYRRQTLVENGWLTDNWRVKEIVFVIAQLDWIKLPSYQINQSKPTKFSRSDCVLILLKKSNLIE